MLLLHTIGARSGQEHVVPMRCLPDGDAFYVFGSAHGSDRDPDWAYNLRAHPDIAIELGTETIPVRAVELHGRQRDVVFARQAARFPTFADYEQRLTRTIPVFRLERRGERPIAEETPMHETTFAQVEREILSWPGVSKQTFAGGQGQGGFQVPAATMFRFGRRELGHIHVTGEADLPVPQKLFHELIAAGRARPHAAGFKGVVTYTVRTPDDVPAAVDLFRLNYERATAARARATPPAVSSVTE